MTRLPVSVLALLAWPTFGFAAVHDGNPANYRTLLNGLVPGDTLVLAAGTYTQGLPLEAKAGTAQLPIVIRGPTDQSAVFAARACCNTVQLDGTSYVEVRNLTLDGLNLDGPFGVDSRGASHHITIENLKIINHGADQQIVGISTKGPAWNWTIRGNTIQGAGTGIYLGNSDGTHPFVAGIIESNLIVDSVGYNLQIKHQLPRPTGIGLPQGASRTVIRNNVFSKRNNASTGANARPNVLVGHFPLAGIGADDVYEIYGNFFYENPTEALFQGEGNIALYDNLFVNSGGDAVNVLPQNDRPRAVTILHNTVVASGGGLRVSGGAAGTVQRIVGNASFAATPISGPNAADNVAGTRAEAVNHLIAPLAAIGSLSLFPKTGSLAGAVLDLAPYNALTDYSKDFNGTPRAGGMRGAYEGQEINPGWALALAIKSGVVANPPLPRPTPAPTVALSANPAQVPAQSRATLTWSSTDATSCQASGGWSGARTTAGSESVGPIASTTNFRLDCAGPGGSQTASTQVATFSAPIVTLAASTARVAQNDSVTLTWNSTGATACAATGAWSGNRGTAGSEASPALTANATFSLSCSGGGGSATQSVAVAVDAPVPAPIPPTPSQSSAGNAGPTTGGGGKIPLTMLLACSVLLCSKARQLRGG